MKKLILTITLWLTFFSALTFGQDLKLNLVWGDLEGNLRDFYNKSFLTSDGEILFVLGGKTVLTQTGAQVQDILNGTRTTDISLIVGKKIIFDSDGASPNNDYMIAASDGDVRFYAESVFGMYVALGIKMRITSAAVEYYVPCRPNTDGGTTLGLLTRRWATAYINDIYMKDASPSISLWDSDVNTGAGANIADTSAIVIETDGVPSISIYDDTGGLTTVTISDSIGLSVDPGILVNTGSLSTTHTLAVDSCFGYVLYVTAAVTITLPAIAEGMSITFITIGANAVSIDANTDDDIWLDGTQIGDGNKATNTSTTGDMIVFTYYSAVGWYAASNSWTDGGA